MQIIGIGGEFRLTLLQRTPGRSVMEPDLHVQCHAKTALFIVPAANAWLEWAEVRAFVDELGVLNATLKGKAEICAMSPRELTLTIKNLDSKGHLGFSFEIGSRNFTDNGQFESGVAGGFEILPTDLDVLLSWFKVAIANKAVE